LLSFVPFVSFVFFRVLCGDSQISEPNRYDRIL